MASQRLKGAIVMPGDAVPLDDLDRMIFSTFEEHYWRKTAFVISRVLRECEGRNLAASDSEIFGRILDLVASGALEAQGDLKRWRYSEVRAVPEDRDRSRGEDDGFRDLGLWLGQLQVKLLREEITIEDVIDRMQTRMPGANAEDQLTLALNLQDLLADAGRYDEALRLIDRMIAQAPDNVDFPISKATLYHHCLDEPENALQAIDVALERAFRTGLSRCEALNEKARILLVLGRGEELGQVLEQIMSLESPLEFPDVEPARDFVDDAPPGLIPEDIVARYNEFCPEDLGSSPEPPKWSPVDQEIWIKPRQEGVVVESPGRERLRAEMDRYEEINQWIRQLRSEVPIADIIDRVQARLQNAEPADRRALELELGSLFVQTNRDDEALGLIDRQIEQRQDDVRPLLSKALHYHYYRDDPEQALVWIDVALERAYRTRFSRREVLGNKARILLRLGRGNELGQVLEEIMALDMYREVSDIGKERDFVDRAPPGMIPDSIVARYDRFFPKQDRALALHGWADHARLGVPIDEAIGRVQSRMKTAIAADQSTLEYILGVFLVNAGRYDEALPLFDSVIERQSDHVRSAIAKAVVHLRGRDDPGKALEAIEFALKRAVRTGFYRRQALGVKARILLQLGRGEELGQVLEQIMLLEMSYDIRDVGRERDFVDRAPPGLIPADVVARYNEFCPRIEADF